MLVGPLPQIVITEDSRSSSEHGLRLADIYWSLNTVETPRTQPSSVCGSNVGSTPESIDQAGIIYNDVLLGFVNRDPPSSAMRRLSATSRCAASLLNMAVVCLEEAYSQPQLPAIDNNENIVLEILLLCPDLCEYVCSILSCGGEALQVGDDALCSVAYEAKGYTGRDLFLFRRKHVLPLSVPLSNFFAKCRTTIQDVIKMTHLQM